MMNQFEEKLFDIIINFKTSILYRVDVRIDKRKGIGMESAKRITLEILRISLKFF